MTSLQHRALCHAVGWLLAGPLLSCSELELENRCDRNPQWCKKFDLLPILEPLNLLDPAHPIAVRLATPDATPEPTKNSAYRVFVEQIDKASVLPPVRLARVLSSPETIEAGWSLREQDLAPLPESVPKLRCGSATLTLYARRYQTSPGTPLVAGDPDSANYVQHGSTDLQVVREPVTPVTWMQFMAVPVPMSHAEWTVTGLDLGPPSSGAEVRDVLYATMLSPPPPAVDNHPAVISGKLSEWQLPEPSRKLGEGKAVQLAGVDPAGNIVLSFPGPSRSGFWQFCDKPPSFATGDCLGATMWPDRAKSIAVDAQGKWLVSVDTSGTLRIQGYSYTATPKTFAVQSPTLEMSSSMYRQAVVGDLDLDGDADVLAWGNSPLVLLQDKDNKPFFSRGDSTGVQAFLAALRTLATADSKIAISHEPCDRRPRLLVAAAGKVTAYVIGKDWTLGQGESVVTVSDQGAASPPITALLRKDTDNDGIADRLIVATQPSSGSPQILVFTPKSTS
jgi:hypothetical protein